MYHLAIITDKRLNKRFYYTVPGDNKLQCSLDAYEEHKKIYGGTDEDYLLDAMPLELDNRPTLVKVQ
jgi:hypothetical protein